MEVYCNELGDSRDVLNAANTFENRLDFMRSSSPPDSCLSDECTLSSDDTLPSDSRTTTTTSSSSKGPTSANQTTTDGNFVFREVSVNTTSSMSILARRINRQYVSEFILPDDTQVAVKRHELSEPVSQLDVVTLTLAIGFTWSSTILNRLNEMRAKSQVNTKPNEPPAHRNAKGQPDEQHGVTVNESNQCLSRPVGDTAKSIDDESVDPFHDCPDGLRIAEYMLDDSWAVGMLSTHPSSNNDLLRYLEQGCRIEPEAYRVERLQRRSNRETKVDWQGRPQVRTINVSPTPSESGSISTILTEIGNED